MNDRTQFDTYKEKVEYLGQTLLDIIASVSTGDYNVNIEIPEDADIEILADIAVGLEFLVEDLKDLNQQQTLAKAELEQRVNRRTRELENALDELQNTQRQIVKEDWQDYIEDGGSAISVAREGDTEKFGDEEWLPGMEQAIQNEETTLLSNGADEHSLSLPIKLQDEVIGIVGLNRDAEQPWEPQEINTIEQIIEQVGLALENQRLFDQSQSALAETDTLYQASAELNTAQTYEEILQVFQKYSLLGGQAHTLAVHYFNTPWTPSKIPDTVTVLAQISDRNELISQEYQLEQSPLALGMLSANQPTIIGNIENDPVFMSHETSANTYIEDMDTRSIVFFPLVVANRWVGFINTSFDIPKAFSEDDIRRTAAITTQASVAVQNLRSIELSEQRAVEAQRRSDELALVNRIVSTVAASMDLRRSLDFVAKELRRAIPKIDEVGIALLNDTKTELEVVADAFRDPNRESGVGVMIPTSNNPSTEQVINTKKPVIINNAGTSEDIEKGFQETLEERDFETLYIFPLIAGNEVIGTVGAAFYLENVELLPDEMRLAETIMLQASTAIQNTRLFNQTQSALTETTSLYQANAELNAVQTSYEVLEVLRRYTILGNDASIITISLFDNPWISGPIPEGSRRIAEWAGLHEFPFNTASTKITDYPHADQIVSRDDLALINDFTDYPELYQTLEQAYPTDIFGIKSFLATPLRTAGQCIGVIIATFPGEMDISEDQHRRLMALAGQAAVAIQNIRLLEETEKRASQLETAAEIARESSGTLELEELLDKSVNLIRNRFNFYHVSIFLLEGSMAVVKASTGEAGRQMVDSRWSLPMAEGRSIIGNVTYNGVPLLVNDVTEDPTHRPHPLLPDTRGELGIPLKIGNRVTGALDVQSDRPGAFSADDIAVLQILADQIAVAVDNARSFEVAQQAVEEMREIDKVKSEFLANMSHELRTPLNSIIGFSRVILKGIDGPINDLQKQDLEAIHGSGQHLLDMINDILDLSRIEAGKMDLTIEEVEIRETIDSVMSTVKGLVKEKDLKIIGNIPDDLPIVRADRTRARQVLINMFSNAVKFTEEGAVTLDVVVYDNPEGGIKPHVRLSVTDTGIGITEEDIALLFDRFSQVDASPTRKAGGTGLGLNISRSLVELMHGEMGVTSVMGEGSTFYFTLPIASASPVVEEEIGGRIVISIEEDEKVIALYERYLKPHGFRVISITDLDQAIEQIKQATPFVITLDVMIGQGKGWKILEDLKADMATQNIPIVVCSILEERERAEKMGASDYLLKPMREDEFVQCITKLGFGDQEDKQRILVVDDDPNVMLIVEKATRRERTLELEYAEGGIKGLASLQEHRPDAVILDLFMPDLDGFSILETMHKDPDMKDIPVVVLTGAELTESERRRLEKYQRALLFKGSFKADELIDSLEEAIQGKGK